VIWRRILVAAIAATALLAGACSRKAPDPAARSHACALAQYWGASEAFGVLDPDGGRTTSSEVDSLAEAAWPDSPATQADFRRLWYDFRYNPNLDTTGDPGGQYVLGIEAGGFMTAHCPLPHA
jgi:hypothetical protein